MRRKQRRSYFSNRGWKNFLNDVKRRSRKQKRRAGAHRHMLNIKKHAQLNNTPYRSVFGKGKTIAKKPPLPINVRYLAGLDNPFSPKHVSYKENGHFLVPSVFSLIDNYQESFDFLKRLFGTLQKGHVKKINLDYRGCKRIDVDASICMDIILAEFISYVHQCRRKGLNISPAEITPTNFDRPEILKILFSIGAYRNIKGLSIKFEDIEALPVLVNDQNDPNIWKKSEVDLTQIVEYIRRCLERMNKELSTEAETEFYKVVGEIMSNAEEHSTMPNRFAIGFFQEVHNEADRYGIFNFSIFNFGDTIYQSFKSPTCKNQRVVDQMKSLSEDYTKRGWFTKPEFKEETLWTLYALQQGVTSKESKRGNGSIEYLENFFRLKGDATKDNISKLMLMSGHSRIVFDGSYSIIKRLKPGAKRPFKMITFNEEGEIGIKPDKNYVTFVPYFFPGTIISARILIKFDNLTKK